MRINGENIPTLNVFPSMMTVPDCVVAQSNKIGSGNGEAKFYIASRDEMHSFYGKEGFEANCFMLKKDLISYLNACKTEYFTPTQTYRKMENRESLWQERMDKVVNEADIITFTIHDQAHLKGPRGYVNSTDYGYKLLREIALPLISYIYVEKIGSEDNPLFYWKLFVDFDAIWEKKNGPLVFSYGKGYKKPQQEPSTVMKTAYYAQKEKEAEISHARIGQGKYRQKLLEQCPFCPFTMVSEERLLIASHIKPWAVSEDNEKIDPYNGYMLSPLYDRLFDQGFITFKENKHIVLSEFISSYTWKKLGLENDKYIQALPMDEKRIQYLHFHHDSVFKGSYDFD